MHQLSKWLDVDIFIITCRADLSARGLIPHDAARIRTEAVNSSACWLHLEVGDNGPGGRVFSAGSETGARSQSAKESDIAWNVGLAPSWRLLDLSLRLHLEAVPLCCHLDVQHGRSAEVVHPFCRGFRLLYSLQSHKDWVVVEESVRFPSSRAFNDGVLGERLLQNQALLCWPSGCTMSRMSESSLPERWSRRGLGRSSPGSRLSKTRPVHSQSVPGFSCKQV